MLRKKLIIILSVVLLVILIIPGIIIQFSLYKYFRASLICSCETTYDYVIYDMTKIVELLKFEKNKNGIYPNFNELKIILKKHSQDLYCMYDDSNDEPILSFIEYGHDIKLTKSSICYKSINQGKKYILKGYAEGEFLGFDVIADINNSRIVNFK